MTPPTRYDELAGGVVRFSDHHCHCEERSDVAIRIPCDAKHRPLPLGAEERIATSGYALLAMTVVSGSGFFFRYPGSNLTGSALSDPTLRN